MVISPTPEELKRLTKRMGVSELKNLEGDLVMSRDSGRNVIFVSGQVRALVTQACVVSGKPVKSEIADSFEAWFADPEQAVSFVKAKQERLVREGLGDLPFFDESEDPEPVVDGKIDAGELVAQYLSLAIDPYPHAEGEQFEQGDDKPKSKDEVYENPFAALKDWKTKQEKGDS
jgi:uncharacterized metal-binding protein YceD (DUF177 family)